MKKAGEITYSTVNRENSGEGLVEFADRSSMEYAMDELDNTKLDGRRIELEQERRSRSRRERRREDRSRSKSSDRRRRQRSKSSSNSD